MTVRDIIEKYLRENGHAGLYNPEISCGCGLDDFMPCGGEGILECVSAIAVRCRGEEMPCSSGCSLLSQHNNVGTCYQDAGAINTDIKKSSSDWLKTDEFKKYKILDPDGWDRSSDENFRKSFYEEMITKQQFSSKLCRSTIYIHGGK